MNSPFTTSAVQTADYHKIQYEELLKEMQKDIFSLTRAIVQSYLEVMGEQDSYEGRKERERLERLSPLVVLELVKKRFYYLQEHINGLIQKLIAESAAETEEKAVDVQMNEITQKNGHLQQQLKQLQERVDGLIKSAEEETRLRIEAAVHSRAVVEAIKEDKKKLEKIIRGKDEEIGKITNVRKEKDKLKKDCESKYNK